MQKEQPTTLVESSIDRYATLPRPAKFAYVTLCIAGLVMTIIYLFSIRFKGWVLVDSAFYFIFIGLFLASVFLMLPGRKKDKTLPWYDLLAACLTAGICTYFYLHSWEIATVVWSNLPLGIILWLLVLEGARRTGGRIFLGVTVVFSLYPLVAGHLPGIFWGQQVNLSKLVALQIFSAQGLLGLMTKTMADILTGYLLFAGLLVGSGAGKFFMNFATVLLGRFRGGPAKVAVLSSGFFGSLSGSVISNVVATGSFTIPSMKKMGYPPQYAGAIEACASTGGMIMPPVMGAVAFVMCELIGVPYATVAIAAILPSLLYYYGLIMQVDAYAAKRGFKGLPKEEIPSLKETLKQGWPFIFVLVFLIWGLLYMRWENYTPWYASGLMVLLSLFNKETRLTPKRLVRNIVAAGGLITETTALILPVGFIVCGLSITGISLSFSAGVVALGGNNVFLILLLGTVACYIMGMVGLVIPAYIFLGLTLAPAAIAVGHLNQIAVHLFIVYYSMLAVITPPVATGSFVAAAIAGSDPMKTSFLSARLGIVIYFIPFFFVYQPALVLQGSLIETVYCFILCLIGIAFVAGGIEGYLLKVGRVEWWARISFVICGFLIALPEWNSTTIGGIVLLFTLAIIWITRKYAKKRDAISKYEVPQQ